LRRAATLRYCVTDEFWERFIEDANQRGVICLPCLDRRCAGIGLGEALLEVQWTGIDHTVVLKPTRVIQYIRLYREPPLLMSDRSIG